MLLLYNDAEHYAKVCFERDYQNTDRVVTVVCNVVADDCNSYPVPTGAVYFRIVGTLRAQTFQFYASSDGQARYFVRAFRLAQTDTLRIGFSAQSPNGPGCTVHFTDINLAQRPVDFWRGN